MPKGVRPLRRKKPVEPSDYPDFPPSFTEMFDKNELTASALWKMTEKHVCCLVLSLSALLPFCSHQRDTKRTGGS